MDSNLPLLLAALVETTGSAPPERIDLTIAQPCAAEQPAGDEVVVCAARGDGSSPYRIAQPPQAKPGVPKAELQVTDGVAAGAETESAAVGGFPSNRLMVRLKIKF